MYRGRIRGIFPLWILLTAIILTIGGTANAQTGSGKGPTDPANTQCPKADTSYGYRSDLAYKAVYKEGTLQKINLYGKDCVDKAKSGGTLTAIGKCYAAEVCHAEAYRDLDGKIKKISDIDNEINKIAQPGISVPTAEEITKQLQSGGTKDPIPTFPGTNTDWSGLNAPVQDLSSTNPNPGEYNFNKYLSGLAGEDTSGTAKTGVDTTSSFDPTNLDGAPQTKLQDPSGTSGDFNQGDPTRFNSYGYQSSAVSDAPKGSVTGFNSESTDGTDRSATGFNSAAQSCDGGLWCTTKEKLSSAWEYIKSGDYLGVGTADAKPSSQTINSAANGETVTGQASVYNPNLPGERSGGQGLATGGTYNPNSYDAAIQTDIGRAASCGTGNTGICYALVEQGDKALVVQVNDNGPLSGEVNGKQIQGDRIVDLNQKSMDYFTGAKNSQALLDNVNVTMLKGEYTPGPIDPATAAALRGVPDINPPAENPRLGAEGVLAPTVDSVHDINFAGVSGIHAVESGTPLADITPIENRIPTPEWDAKQYTADAGEQITNQIRDASPNQVGEAGQLSDRLAQAQAEADAADAQTARDQAALMQQNDQTQAELDAQQQLQADQNKALADRLAQADAETAAYQQAQAEGNARADKALAELPLPPDAPSANDITAQINADNLAADQADLMAKNDATVSQSAGDQAVLDAIKKEQGVAQSAVDAAQKRLDAANNDAQIAELQGDRPCVDTGFIQCPAAAAERQLAVAQKNLQTVNSNYEQCASGKCPDAIVAAQAQAQKGPGETSVVFKAAETSFATDMNKRIEALKEGSPIMAPVHVAYVLSDGLGYTALHAPRTLLEGTSVGDYLGFRAAPQDAIANAANPGRDLEEKINAGRDVALLTVPVAADLSIGSRGMQSLGGWTQGVSAAERTGAEAVAESSLSTGTEGGIAADSALSGKIFKLNERFDYNSGAIAEAQASGDTARVAQLQIDQNATIAARDRLQSSGLPGNWSPAPSPARVAPEVVVDETVLAETGANTALETGTTNKVPGQANISNNLTAPTERTIIVDEPSYFGNAAANAKTEIKTVPDVLRGTGTDGITSTPAPLREGIDFTGPPTEPLPPALRVEIHKLPETEAGSGVAADVVGEGAPNTASLYRPTEPVPTRLSADVPAASEPVSAPAPGAADAPIIAQDLTPAPQSWYGQLSDSVSNGYTNAKSWFSDFFSPSVDVPQVNTAFTVPERTPIAANENFGGRTLPQPVGEAPVVRAAPNESLSPVSIPQTSVPSISQTQDLTTLTPQTVTAVSDLKAVPPSVPTQTSVPIVPKTAEVSIAETKPLETQQKGPIATLWDNTIAKVFGKSDTSGLSDIAATPPAAPSEISTFEPAAGSRPQLATEPTQVPRLDIPENSHPTLKVSTDVPPSDAVDVVISDSYERAVIQTPTDASKNIWDRSVSVTGNQTHVYMSAEDAAALAKDPTASVTVYPIPRAPLAAEVKVGASDSIQNIFQSEVQKPSFFAGIKQKFTDFLNNIGRTESITPSARTEPTLTGEAPSASGAKVPEIPAPTRTDIVAGDTTPRIIIDTAEPKTVTPEIKVSNADQSAPTVAPVADTPVVENKSWTQSIKDFFGIGKSETVAPAAETFDYAKAPIGIEPTVRISSTMPEDAVLVRLDNVGGNTSRVVASTDDVAALSSARTSNGGLQGYVSRADADALTAMREGTAGAPENIALTPASADGASLVTSKVADTAGARPLSAADTPSVSGIARGAAETAGSTAGSIAKGTYEAAKATAGFCFGGKLAFGTCAVVGGITYYNLPSLSIGPWTTSSNVTKPAGAGPDAVAPVVPATPANADKIPAGGLPKLTLGGIQKVLAGPAAPASPVAPAAPAQPETGISAGSILSALGSFLGGMFTGLGGASGSSNGAPVPTTAAPATVPTTPATTPIAPSVAFVANPASVAAGNTAQLSWASVGSTGCTITAPDASVVTTGSYQGSFTTKPLATTTVFSIECKGGTKSVSGQVTVTVK